jgi:hypothetical protein
MGSPVKKENKLNESLAKGLKFHRYCHLEDALKIQQSHITNTLKPTGMKITDPFIINSFEDAVTFFKQYTFELNNRDLTELVLYKHLKFPVFFNEYKQAWFYDKEKINSDKLQDTIMHHVQCFMDTADIAALLNAISTRRFVINENAQPHGRYIHMKHPTNNQPITIEYGKQRNLCNVTYANGNEAVISDQLSTFYHNEIKKHIAPSPKDNPMFLSALTLINKEKNQGENDFVPYYCIDKNTSICKHPDNQRWVLLEHHKRTLIGAHYRDTQQSITLTDTLRSAFQTSLDDVTQEISERDESKDHEQVEFPSTFSKKINAGKEDDLDVNDLFDEMIKNHQRGESTGNVNVIRAKGKSGRDLHNRDNAHRTKVIITNNDRHFPVMQTINGIIKQLTGSEKGELTKVMLDDEPQDTPETFTFIGHDKSYVELAVFRLQAQLILTIVENKT